MKNNHRFIWLVCGLALVMMGYLFGSLRVIHMLNSGTVKVCNIDGHPPTGE